MDDLIRRQDAIDIVVFECGRWTGLAKEISKQIKQLPSAQPETNCSEFPNNSDTISRQAAIDALDKRFDSIPMEQTTEILLLRKDLRDLPSTQPKTGKWIEIPHTFMWQCSLCSWINDISSDFNYCPDCGAKMEGEEND